VIRLFQPFQLIVPDLTLLSAAASAESVADFAIFLILATFRNLTWYMPFILYTKSSFSDIVAGLPRPPAPRQQSLKIATRMLQFSHTTLEATTSASSDSAILASKLQGKLTWPSG
jgi:lactate dehydrogenase-like 2-hydroxyacid dehydrogenase